MKQFVTDFNSIQSNNIALCIRNISDLNFCSFLDLSQEIIVDIEKTLSKLHSTKSQCRQYFIGNKKYQTLYVFFLQEDGLQKRELFFGEHFPKLPDDICLICSNEIKISFYEVCELSRYLYQEYKTQKKKRKTQVLINKNEKKIFEESRQKIDNIILARNLGNMPANVLIPELFAQQVKKTKFSHAHVSVLSYKDIQKEGLGLIEGVGKGSNNKPCLVLIEYIYDKKQPIVGIIGKGVTFDTGGNQIKPENYMYEMKGDMGGAAVVFALAKEIDRKKIKKNFIFALPIAENVVSSNSYKPSDILIAYNKKTVEVIHTDAEGRLILADAISYVGKKYKTSEIISIATLTGACIAALGYRYAGIMGTNKNFIQKCVDYGKENSEMYIELPFDDLFIEKTKSEIADYKNLDRGVHAGSSMGAAFLSQFLENNELYTHIDIAGTYMNGGDAYGRCPKTMTGFGVESLSQLLSEDI